MPWQIEIEAPTQRSVISNAQTATMDRLDSNHSVDEIINYDTKELGAHQYVPAGPESAPRALSHLDPSRVLAPQRYVHR